MTDGCSRDYVTTVTQFLPEVQAHAGTSLTAAQATLLTADGKLNERRERRYAKLVPIAADRDATGSFNLA
jgi:hypothetical protein